MQAESSTFTGPRIRRSLKDYETIAFRRGKRVFKFYHAWNLAVVCLLQPFNLILYEVGKEHMMHDTHALDREVTSSLPVGTPAATSRVTSCTTSALVTMGQAYLSTPDDAPPRPNVRAAVSLPAD